MVPTNGVEDCLINGVSRVVGRVPGSQIACKLLANPLAEICHLGRSSLAAIPFNRSDNLYFLRQPPALIFSWFEVSTYVLHITFQVLGSKASGECIDGVSGACTPGAAK